MSNSDEIEVLNKDDLDIIREVGSRVIRNLSLFMDNPFQYAHLIHVCEQDIQTLDQIKARCGLSGDGMLPAHPLGHSPVGGADVASVLLDAGFARLREVVDDMIQNKGDNNE